MFLNAIACEGPDDLSRDHSHYNLRPLKCNGMWLHLALTIVILMDAYPSSQQVFTPLAAEPVVCADILTIAVAIPCFISIVNLS